MSQARPRASAAAKSRYEAIDAEEYQDEESHGQNLCLPQGFGITLFCLLFTAVAATLIACMAVGILSGPIGISLLFFSVIITTLVVWWWAGCPV